MKKIKIKRLRADVPMPLQFDGGDWVDLRAAEEVVLKAGEYKAIPLGVAMELPRGYEAIIAPRSSTFKYMGLMPANGIGIVDESYKGDNDEWHFLAYAARDTMVMKGDRICQFRIVKHQPKIGFRMVTRLGNRSRGGIGSTGRK